MKKNRKGQTAMEYLLTYGWAIIIVIIVGIALWRLGVFTPSVGKTSSGFDEFSVGTDFKITSDGGAELTVVNRDKQSREVTMNEVTVDGATCTGDSGAEGAGDSWGISCTGLTAGSVGTPYTGTLVVMNYTVGGNDYTETGKISGKFE